MKALNICADFSLFPDNHKLGPSFTHSGFSFVHTSGMTAFVNITGDERGLQFPDEGLEITLPVALSAVTLRIGTFAGDVKMEVKNTSGQVIRQQNIPGINSYMDIHIAAAEIFSIRLTGGGNEAIIPRICGLLCCRSRRKCCC